MCGRFTLKTNASSWVEQLFSGLTLLDVPENPPRYNIAPTQPILCVLQSELDDQYHVVPMRWGLVPHWADDLAIGNRMINARSETLTEKPSFRQPFAKQRCLIITDGYYEWKTVDKKTKIPFWIHPASGGCMAMAGVWDCNKKITHAQPVLSSSVITTNSNATTMSIHDRMPVFIDPHDFKMWLDPKHPSDPAIVSLLKPASNDYLKVTQVSSRVNNPRHEDASCLEPELSQPGLF